MENIRNQKRELDWLFLSWRRSNDLLIDIPHVRHLYHRGTAIVKSPDEKGCSAQEKMYSIIFMYPG